MSPIKTGADHFAVGALNMYSQRNPKTVAAEYAVAIATVPATDRGEFMLRRMRDHITYGTDNFARNELKHLRAPVENKVREFKKAVSHKTKTPANPVPQTKARAVEEQKPTVRSDSQNVHDSALTKEFSEQYSKLEPGSDKDLTAYKKWLSEKHSDLYPGLMRLLNSNLSVYDRTSGSDKAIPEQQVVSRVWKRIHADHNAANKDKLIEALSMRIAAMHEHGEPVCTTGRCEQVLSSLATLDTKDPELGSLKTTEIIKGQMFSQGSKIIESEIGKLPQNIQDAYNKSEAVKTLNPADLDTLKSAIGKIRTRIDSEIRDTSKLVESDTQNVVKTINDTVELD